MAISFACTCGKSFTVDENLAGKRTRCPACRESLTVPVPAGEPEVIEDFEVIEDDLEMVEDDAPTAYGLSDDRPPVGEADAEPEFVEDEPAPEDDGKPDYFAVGYDGSGSLIHKPRSFRVYPDGDELLFVHAGPFNWNAVDTAFGKNVAAGMIVRNAAMYGAAGAGLGLIAAGAIAIAVAVDRKAVAKRAAVLDPMTLDDLRAEVESDKESFRVTADNTSEVRVEPPKTGLFVNKMTEPHVVGRLRFAHEPTGKWSMVVLTRPDGKAAIREFRRVLGRDNVEVELRFKKERG